MGLIANIHKHNGQSCSLNGLSERFNDVVIVNADGPFDPTPTMPAVMLIRGPGGNGHVIAVPAMLAARNDKAAQWVEMTDMGSRMNGGTFIHSSDSRFHELVAKLGGQRGTAVSFHDRFEAWR